MPELPVTPDEIEERLLRALDLARRRYQSHQSNGAAYLKVLNIFTDFIVDGILPEDLRPSGKPPGRSELAGRALRKKRG